MPALVLARADELKEKEEKTQPCSVADRHTGTHWGGFGTAVPHESASLCQGCFLGFFCASPVVSHQWGRGAQGGGGDAEGQAKVAACSA